MRKLDLEEKQFLTEIIKQYQIGELTCLAALVDIYLVDKDIQIDFDKKLAEVHFDSQKFLNNNFLVDEVRLISWKLTKLVNLLKYLQDQGFLYLWKEAVNSRLERYGQLVDGNPLIKYKINDTHIAKLLVNYSFRTIVIGQTLVDYVKNNYQTREDIQFAENISIANASLETARKSVSRATIAIWVSVIMALVSIITSFYLVNYQTEKPISIDSKQIDQVLNSINKIENKMETIENRFDRLKLPDTLKTIVTKPIKIDTIK